MNFLWPGRRSLRRRTKGRRRRGRASPSSAGNDSVSPGGEPSPEGKSQRSGGWPRAGGMRGSLPEMPPQGLVPDGRAFPHRGKVAFAEQMADEGDGTEAYRQVPSLARRAGQGRGVPEADPPPFSFRGIEKKTAAAGQKKRCCDERAAHLGRPFVMRESCESVRWASMAPSALRYTPAVEIPCLRIDPAAEGRGYLSTWSASLSAAAAWALAKSPGSGSGPGTALPLARCRSKA